MDNDQRLTPLPASIAELQTTTHSVPSAYSVYYDDESLEGKRSIKQYFSVVYKRLPIILAITLIVTSAVALYMFKQPAEYRATASMLIEPPRPKVTDKDSININLGTDVNYGPWAACDRAITHFGRKVRIVQKRSPACRTRNTFDRGAEHKARSYGRRRSAGKCVHGDTLKPVIGRAR
jgi:hypothetical protein